MIDKVRSQGFTIDPSSLTVSLPQGKLNKLIERASATLHHSKRSIREVVEVIGLIVSSSPVIKLARLHYRHLEFFKVHWKKIWMISMWHARCLRKLKMSSNGFRLGVICTVAHQLRSIRQSWCWLQMRLSQVGVWRLKINRRIASGRWKKRKETTHQLTGTANGSVRASGFSLLVMRSECNQSVLRQLNCSCVCQNMGGKIVSLNCIAYSIWESCLSFDCSVEVFHVPGVENVWADRLSRKHESSLEWKLHPTVLKWIAERFFSQDINLFAWRFNYQVGRYVSWKPDPAAWAGVDAFSVVWSCLKPYLFPPFSLLGKVLQKLKVEEDPNVVMITPDWPTAHWFPPIWETVCDFLSDQFGEGKSYSTVNSYRSALSGMLVPVNERPIGEHPVIVQLLRSILNVRPPVPRYNGT